MSDTCPNCGYAAKRKNPDCGDHQIPVDNLSQDIEQILDKVWGAGLDFGSSDDFSNLIDNERDKAYLTYKGNIEKQATSALTQLFNKRLIEELRKVYGDGEVYVRVKGGFVDLDARIAQLKEAQQ